MIKLKCRKEYIFSHLLMDIHTKERYGGVLASKTTITDGSTRQTSSNWWLYMPGKCEAYNVGIATY